jgi:hypothetical protein
LWQFLWHLSDGIKGPFAAGQNGVRHRVIPRRGLESSSRISISFLTLSAAVYFIPLKSFAIQSPPRKRCAMSSDQRNVQFDCNLTGP